MLSAFALYSVGIGPSSSHTVGPMRAAKRFVDLLAAEGRLTAVARVRAQLFGSLGATGHGHGSAKAVVLGLQGEDPATVDTDTADAQVGLAADRHTLRLAGRHEVAYDPAADIMLHRRRSLPAHPNGMVFTAYDTAGVVLAERTYYSVGGGFIQDHTIDGDPGTGPGGAVVNEVPTGTTRVPFPSPGPWSTPYGGRRARARPPGSPPGSARWSSSSRRAGRTSRSPPVSASASARPAPTSRTSSPSST